MMDTLCSFSLKNREEMKNILVNLIQGSTKHQFNFISTLQKGLIKMCQKYRKFVNISIKDITIHSNTIDYAILFTEENIIQGSSQIDKIQIRDALTLNQGKLIDQWSDLIDYYQFLNEPDLVESVMIKLLEG